MSKLGQKFKSLSRGARVAIISGAALATVMGIGIAGATADRAINSQTDKQPNTASTNSVGPTVTTKNETQKLPVKFSTKRQDDPNLAKPSTRMIQFGVDGERTITTRITYTDGKETGRTQVSDVVTTPPVDEIIAIGTKEQAASNCNPNYDPCVPNSAYDLDCADIGFEVTVIGSDPYRLDADHDGYGCESY